MWLIATESFIVKVFVSFVPSQRFLQFVIVGAVAAFINWSPRNSMHRFPAKKGQMPECAQDEVSWLNCAHEIVKHVKGRLSIDAVKSLGHIKSLTGTIMSYRPKAAMVEKRVLV